MMVPRLPKLSLAWTAAALLSFVALMPVWAEGEREAWRDGFLEACRFQAESLALCAETTKTIAANLNLAEKLKQAALDQSLPEQTEALASLFEELQALQRELACEAENEFCDPDGTLEETFDKSTTVCGLPDEVDCGELTQQFNDRVAQGNERIVAHNRISNRNNEIADLLKEKRAEIVAVAKKRQEEAEAMICHDESDCIARARLKPGRDGVDILKYACDDAPQSARACNKLGWALFTGLWEGGRLLGDIDEGLKVLRRACDLGHEETCARLAEIPEQLDLPQMRLEMAEKNEALRQQVEKN